MGIINFIVIFDNPVKTYTPGETVSGKIALELDSSKKCRGIKIKIMGEARTRWKQASQNGSKQIRGHEEYFSEKYYLVGGASEEVELDPGEHVYPFQQILPQNLPSSFELELPGNQGYIRYTVKGIIDRPWKFDNETKAAFTVVSKYDLNADPIASEPVMEKEIKTFGIFSQSPPLTIDMSLPVRGYVPGQSTPIRVNIDNQSGFEIYDIKLKLEKYVKYLGTPSLSAKKKASTTIVKVHKGKVENNYFSFDHIFEIPPLPPSNLGDNCKIIKIRYALELEAYINRMCSRNLKMSTPILIGTVPLANYRPFVASSIDPSRGQFHPSAPSPSEISPSAPPDYFSVVNSPKGEFDLLPPTYEESMFVAGSLQDHDDSDHVMGIREHFAPRYAVYKFSSHQ